MQLCGYTSFLTSKLQQLLSSDTRQSQSQTEVAGQVLQTFPLQRI